jgi:hypothetical protein
MLTIVDNRCGEQNAPEYEIDLREMGYQTCVLKETFFYEEKRVGLVISYRKKQEQSYYLKVIDIDDREREPRCVFSLQLPNFTIDCVPEMPYLFYRINRNLVVYSYETNRCVAISRELVGFFSFWNEFLIRCDIGTGGLASTSIFSLRTGKRAFP